MSLRGLINLRILFSVIVILLMGGIMAIWQARESVEDELESSFNLALQMVEFGLQQFSRTPHSEDEWLQHIAKLQATRHLNITVLDEAGNYTDVKTTEDFPREQIPPQWFIDAVMAEEMATTYQIRFSDGREQQIIIKAEPIDEILEAWSESQGYFWSICLMMMIIFLAINVVFNSMLQTVQRIQTALKQLTTGDYEKRLPNFKISEFDIIASEINSLTDALNEARENNQALARHTIHIQEKERQTMSRELHDEMGQSLTAVKAMAVAVKQPSSNRLEIADSIIDICNHLSGVVRSMMRTLHPLSLSDLGLAATLKDLVHEWKRRYPQLLVNLYYDEKLDFLDEEVAIHVYRIVQECLTNVVRHAEASRVEVNIKSQTISHQQDVIVQVEDNGRGGANMGAGFGLLGMRERVESIGGKLSVKSSQGNGVLIIAQMPFIENKK